MEWLTFINILKTDNEKKIKIDLNYCIKVNCWIFKVVIKTIQFNDFFMKLVTFKIFKTNHLHLKCL